MKSFTSVETICGYTNGGVKPRGLADHLARLEEERWGNGEAEGLGGLEVDDQLERGGLLHGQVGRRGPFKNRAYTK
jgi:hypothetical protein